ncbi:AcrR family transcriptional regulator [Pedobacter cryoconitis]|uniref:AcrR family transcriptional regulator n=1 Tax=Pedobacter cryoconitis TaxID=188932 RepID=A0A7W8ZIJ4_9SPHI|nr:TetR/AcrR family transcriptional regulator [Pedobacter cryoconitis]MBB5634578.1 AcrR family transcriptional regulator [Pedobacter cryoconitis]
MSASEPIKDDAIQKQILQAAKQLFQAHGLQKVTMDDVAKAIGKGRSSLYYYYKSKDEILDAVMDDEIRENLNAVALAIDRASSAEQKLNAFYLTRLALLEKRRALYSALDVGMDANEMSNFNKAKHAIHKRVVEKESALLNQILTNGMKTGELRKIAPKDLDDLIFVLLSSLHGLKREMVLDNDFSRVETAVNVLSRLTIHGLKQ